MSESSSSSSVIDRNEWIIRLGSPDTADTLAAVEKIARGSRSFYLCMAAWNNVKVKHRRAREQFTMVQRQGWAFDKALLESISISTEGKRVATDGAYICKNIREEGLQYPQFVDLLNLMIDHAKKAAKSAREVRETFTGIRKEFLKVYVAVPKVAQELKADSNDKEQKLKKLKQRLDKGAAWSMRSLIAFYDRHAMNSAEATLKDWRDDARNNLSLEGSLQTVIDGVSLFVNWWDRDVEQLEKLRDDGNFVVSDLQHISPAVAAKMESEWSELSREYTNYAEKIKVISDACRVDLRIEAP